MSQQALAKRTSDITPVLSQSYLEGANSLATKVIPASAVKKRPGKGGQTFDYVKHTWVTEVLQNTLSHLWSFDVLNWEIFNDSKPNVAVLCKLSVNIPLQSGGFLERSVTEVGAFEDGTGKMPTAMMVAAGASRGLCRCVMRMFGLGIQFYKDTDDPTSTPDGAWTALRTFAKNKGHDNPDEIAAALKESGISSSELVDRFEEAYAIVASLVGSAPVIESVPEGL